MDLLHSIIGRLCGGPLEGAEADHVENVAEQVVQIISNAEKNGPSLRAQIKGTVQAEGWTEGIAKTILAKLQQVVEQGKEDWGPVMREAINTARKIVLDIFQLALDHPVAATIFCTLVALGILVLITPWVIEALGFGKLGPIEGTFATWWQSTYRGSRVLKGAGCSHQASFMFGD
ncbi:hypothetical protein UA08_07026 [Talaromyces atroroseus]|uniref:Uncharacterized protein n=1 Tax=Talaromyces atroroseus TaxID=1441469 RepID=A0A225AA25_TALAT|nr:hypothetical protein UA08_07026 [Talaromyces atroroseus]OKL57791.1 hypothetical protein UA08_07026 [Talaromyces atroroseus]